MENKSKKRALKEEDVEEEHIEKEEEEEAVVSHKKIKKEQLDPILIKDGVLRWSKNFLSEEEADALYDHLVEELNWVQGEMTIYGKKVKTPRIQSWVADEDMVVKELFQKQKQHPWTPQLTVVRERIESILGCRFDYLLLNRYRDGNDYIGWHADREAIKEGKDHIASISLGAPRRFILRHNKTNEKIEYSLTKGSLIVMEGATQANWKHTVPKQLTVKDQRINLTFRIKKD
eukprot:TRINITY_DN16079_c0_g1_i1.p1 TRINITY_DN16079_c0_g1~~TRINITY_DN16079_c0_g1_i1.p1  ORF type:complete len:232 (-),score=84.02 TRINITY_DN16079_c0_g1_i1:34-729(-)